MNHKTITQRFHFSMDGVYPDGKEGGDNQDAVYEDGAKRVTHAVEHGECERTMRTMWEVWHTQRFRHHRSLPLDVRKNWRDLL